jgi:4-amino-4-deoxychorismate lyase
VKACFINGRRTSTLLAGDRGLLYGDGLFETIAVRGGQPRFWQAHYARLRVGCQRLGIEPPAESRVSRELAAALRASGRDDSDAVAKIIVTAGSGSRGYRRPSPMRPTVLIQVDDHRPLERACYIEGVGIVTCKTSISQQPQVAGIKTLNRLDQVLARDEFDDQGVFEGLMFDADDRLICGTMSNVFIVRENSVATPSLERCGIAGIMREQVIASAARDGIPCRVCDIGHAELARADELFLTNSQFGLLPVATIDNRALQIGPVTRQCMRALEEIGVAECGA